MTGIRYIYSAVSASPSSTRVRGDSTRRDEKEKNKLGGLVCVSSISCGQRTSIFDEVFSELHPKNSPSQGPCASLLCTTKRQKLRHHAGHDVDNFGAGCLTTILFYHLIPLFIMKDKERRYNSCGRSMNLNDLHQVNIELADGIRAMIDLLDSGRIRCLGPNRWPQIERFS